VADLERERARLRAALDGYDQDGPAEHDHAGEPVPVDPDTT
jgi:hypothetical protein